VARKQGKRTGIALTPTLERVLIACVKDRPACITALLVHYARLISDTADRITKKKGDETVWLGVWVQLTEAFIACVHEVPPLGSGEMLRTCFHVRAKEVQKSFAAGRTSTLLSPNSVTNLMNLAHEPFSLDTPIGDDDRTPLEMLVGSLPTPEEVLQDEQAQHLILGLIDTLKEKERMVLRHYYLDSLALNDIASVLDLSYTRVHDLWRSGIRRLRTRYGAMLSRSV
jgi:RNA polymerase sigma factor (sigma-70 family)